MFDASLLKTAPSFVETMICEDMRGRRIGVRPA
jgi:hypothetical protein